MQHNLVLVAGSEKPATRVVQGPSTFSSNFLFPSVMLVKRNSTLMTVTLSLISICKIISTKLKREIYIDLCLSSKYNIAASVITYLLSIIPTCQTRIIIFIYIQFNLVTTEIALKGKLSMKTKKVLSDILSFLVVWSGFLSQSPVFADSFFLLQSCFYFHVYVCFSLAKHPHFVCLGLKLSY